MHECNYLQRSAFSSIERCRGTFYSFTCGVSYILADMQPITVLRLAVIDSDMLNVSNEAAFSVIGQPRLLFHSEL